MPAFSFSKKEAFRVGWERFKERPFFVIGLFVITTLISTVSGYLVDKANAGPSVAFIFSVIDFAVQAIIGMGLTLILLRVHDNVTTDYSDLFEPIYLFWKYLAMTIIVFVVVIIGLLLFVIPGIIAAIALSFAPYLVIDKGMGPIDAVKESVEMTHGHRWNLFIFALLVAAFNVLGFLLLGVGLLITIPVSALAFVHIYRWLLHPKEESGVVVSWLSKILSAFVLFIIAVVVAFVILLGSLAASNSPQARDIERRADIAEMMLGVELYRDATG
ncbi:MAG: YciC family protein, partial [bacterium]|nr:YciC family protein [bacterium]